MNGEQLAEPEAVFEIISELEFDQTASLPAEAGRDIWTHSAGANASPDLGIRVLSHLGVVNPN